MIEWIDLGRQFVDSPKETEDDHHTFDPDFWALLGNRGGKTWEQILQYPMIVILGEAGSGKSVEFEAQSKRLNGEGQTSFSLPLEAMADDGLELILSPAENQALENWKAGETLGYFFLDSVDESRLGDDRNPIRALQHLRQDLGLAYERARLVISCRYSDWRFQEDESAFLELHPISPQQKRQQYADQPNNLPIIQPKVQADQELFSGLEQEPEKDQQEPELRVFVFQPLDNDQIKVVAEAVGVENGDSFLEAILNTGIRSLASRPLDAIWLAEYWKDHGIFGTKVELLEENLNKRIAEPQKRRPTLPPNDALEGLQRLSGVATLCARFRFCLPATQRSGSIQDCLFPEAILSGWPASQVTELLSRGVFDAQTYGQVRFHHREVQEYLAARWIQGLLQRGLSRYALDSILFPQSWGKSVIPGHLKAVAAWLSLWDDLVFSHVLELSPQSLLSYGDPSKLTVEQRLAILDRFLCSVEDVEGFSDSFDRPQLGMFAHPELAPHLSARLIDSGLGEDARILLLRIARWGRLTGVVPISLSIALDSTLSPRVRSYAVQVVHEAGQIEDRQTLLPLLEQEIEPDFVAGLLEAVFPELINVDQLLNALVRVKKERKAYSNFETYCLQVLPQECPREHLSGLATQLADRVLTQPVPTSANVAMRSGIEHLLPALYAAVTEIVNSYEQPDTTIDPVLGVCNRLMRLRRHYSSVAYGESEFQNALRESPAYRRAMFWWAADQEAENSKYPRDSGFLYRNTHTLRLSHDDLAWLCVDAENLGSPEKRHLAFNTFLEFTPFDQLQPLQSQRVAKMIGSNPAFEIRLARYVNVRTFENPQNVKWQRQDKARKLREQQENKKAKEVLQSKIEQVRNGTDAYLLAHLYSMANHNSAHSGDVDVTPLVEMYGKEITMVAMEGWKNAWGNIDPGLPHERKEKNQTPYYIVYGLSGIALDIAEGVRLEGLPKDIGIQAVRYAAWELNNFPGWLENLAHKRPDWVREGLEPVLRAEFNHPADEDQPHDVLSKLAHAPVAVREACRGTLSELLWNNDPPHPKILEWVLHALGAFEGSPDEEWAILAGDRCESATYHIERMRLWWAVLLFHAPTDAIMFIKTHMSDLPPADAEEAFISVVGKIWNSRFGDRSDLLSNANVEDLEALTMLAYRHVKPEQDISHDGVYSPGNRDHAQDFRWHLLQRLNNFRTEASYQALRRLSVTPETASINLWLKDKLRDYAANNPSIGPLTPTQALEWSQNGTYSPGNADQLFRLGLARIKDIQDWIERHDFSQRSVYNQNGVHEDAFQRLLADELLRRANNHYAVTREDEVDSGGEPDIRLHATEFSGRLAIEIKVAENWTGPKLLSQLESQLLESYLTTPDSQHGIYLLCSRGTSSKWQIGRKRLDFCQLLSVLKDKADELVETNPNVLGLEIVGIDFHEPSDRAQRSQVSEPKL